MKTQLKTIIDKANEKTTFQDACYYIVEELERIFPDWDTREKVIQQIEKEYNTNIIY